MFKQKCILNFSNDTETLFLRKYPSNINFSTFFNSLNLYLVKKYISASKVKVLAHFSNVDSVEFVYRYKKKYKSLPYERINNNEYVIDISSLPKKGILYPVFSGDIRRIDIKDCTYEIECESRDISPCVLITTYNRQEFLIPNLRKLNACEGLAHVIVVDNAKNVKLPDDLDKSKFTVIPNDNLGGTGGFTRGMIEAKKRGFSHIFIMDDDITLILEVMEKTFSLVSSFNDTHQNDWVGFSMLINDNPLVQYELGTKWTGSRMKLNNHKFDVANLKKLYKNQVNKKYNYSAWWSLMMPTSVVDKYGYPFPFFIKFDDIEYGLRRTGEEIVLTNGFGVWHESFEKKFNPYLEYYLFRNACVTNAIHSRHPIYRSCWRYLKKSIRFYLKGEYTSFKLLNLGYDDYLKGPDFFRKLDIEGNNKKLREIAKEKQPTLKSFFTIPFIACARYFKLIFVYNKVRKEYLNHYQKLTSLEYWEKVFNHE